MPPPESTQRIGAENATDQYGRIFVLLLGVFFFSMFMSDSQWLRMLIALSVIVVVVLTLRATGVTAQIMRNTLYAAGLLSVVAVAAGFAEADFVSGSVSFAAAGGMGASVMLLLRRIFEMEQIRLPEVVAGLTAYTQLALGFAFLYAGASDLTEGAFFNDGIVGEASDFIYFSVVTVTTLGYGDLTPATDVGRSLVILETLLGQIFLIVLVAFLVGMLGKKRPILDSEDRPRRRRRSRD